MKHYREETEVEGWCEECGDACSGVLVDQGIGPYEYWGSRGTHHDWVVVSPCCEAGILDTDPHCSKCGKLGIEDYGLCLECLEAEEICQ